MPATRQHPLAGGETDPGGASRHRFGFRTAGVAALLAVSAVALWLIKPVSVAERAGQAAENSDVAVERSDAPPRLFAFLAAGLAAFLAVSATALWLIYPSAVSGPSDAPRQATAKPRLQIDPVADLAAHRAAAVKALAGYGWVDRERGLVRIPIDQAMQDVATAGIADWPKDAK